MNTTAAVLFETGHPLRILELELPPLQRGQVLVRVAYSGICRSQLMEVQGKRGPDRWLPHLLGHEGSGVVEAVGAGVTKIKAGDHVVLTWIKGKGLDVPGPRFQHGGQTVNAGPITTFCTRAVVAENRCVRIPRPFPLDAAALLGCALPTGAGIVLHEVCPEPGSRVAVFGVGGIGLSAVVALGLYKCARVIAVDRDVGRLRLARRLGATHSVNSTRRDPVEVIRRLTGGTGVDYSIEASGTTAGIEAAFAAVRPAGGLCVFASHPPTGRKIRLDPHALICGKRIQGSWGGASQPDRDIPRLAALCRKGRLPLARIVSHRFPFHEIKAAMTLMARGRAARILLKMPFDLNRPGH